MVQPSQEENHNQINFNAVKSRASVYERNLECTDEDEATGEIQHGREIEGGYVSKVFALSLDECALPHPPLFPCTTAWRVEEEASSSAAGWR